MIIYTSALRAQKHKLPAVALREPHDNSSGRGARDTHTLSDAPAIGVFGVFGVFGERGSESPERERPSLPLDAVHDAVPSYLPFLIAIDFAACRRLLPAALSVSHAESVPSRRLATRSPLVRPPLRSTSRRRSSEMIARSRSYSSVGSVNGGASPAAHAATTFARCVQTARHQLIPLLIECVHLVWRELRLAQCSRLVTDVLLPRVFLRRVPLAKAPVKSPPPRRSR